MADGRMQLHCSICLISAGLPKAMNLPGATVRKRRSDSKLMVAFLAVQDYKDRLVYLKKMHWVTLAVDTHDAVPLYKDDLYAS